MRQSIDVDEELLWRYGDTEVVTQLEQLRHHLF